MNILVKMEWSEIHQKYLMKLPSGKFLYDLWDCESINHIFNNRLDKNESRWFELNIEERNNGSRGEYQSRDKEMDSEVNI